MPWSERQLAMLDEMGVRLWSAAPRSAVGEAAPATAASFGGQGGSSGGSPAAERPSRRPPPPRRPVDAAPPAPATPPAPTAATRSAPVIAAAEDPQRAVRIAAMDWPALAETVASCRACRLCDSRRNTVFGVGHRSAHWMIVGEAPGENEDLQGEPFVGKAGQLLDNMLRSIGLARTEGSPQTQVFIANTLKCRPPANRNPLPDELEQCEPFLRRQIALIAPRILVAMGRFAVQSLLRTTEPIGRLRGRVHAYEGVPLVVTYHPAYLLRNPADKARAWDDLCLARAVAEGAANSKGEPR